MPRSPTVVILQSQPTILPLCEVITVGYCFVCEHDLIMDGLLENGLSEYYQMLLPYIVTYTNVP